MAYQQYKELINTLNECIAECIHCATACSEENNAQLMSRCIKLDNDCVDICRLAVSYLCRESESREAILEQCARICEACSVECERHSRMEHCRRCAKACRKCADACHQPA